MILLLYFQFHCLDVILNKSLKSNSFTMQYSIGVLGAGGCAPTPLFEPDPPWRLMGQVYYISRMPWSCSSGLQTCSWKMGLARKMFLPGSVINFVNRTTSTNSEGHDFCRALKFPALFSHRGAPVSHGEKRNKIKRPAKIVVFFPLMIDFFSWIRQVSLKWTYWKICFKMRPVL